MRRWHFEILPLCLILCAVGVTTKDGEMHKGDEDFKCLWTDARKFADGLLLSEYPKMTARDPSKQQLCCVDFVAADVKVISEDPHVFYRFFTDVSKRDELDIAKEKKGPYCRMVDSIFRCCCQTSQCNTQLFASKAYNQVIATFFTSKWFLVYVIGISSIVFVSFLLTIFFVIAHFTFLHKFASSELTEVPPMLNIDLRGIAVQPMYSEAETEAILKQIKKARTTKAPEPVEVKKLRLRSVATFSTPDDITIREPAPIVLPPFVTANPCMEMLTYMIKHGSREIKFDPNNLIACYEKALVVLKKEPILQETTLPVTIVGDIHGQYSDLIRWFHLNGWPPTTRYVFMGDYVDRGRHCLEVITILLCLKACMPNDIFINRGNHEDAIIGRNYSFYAECINRLPNNAQLNQKVFDKLAECFSWMPIVTKVSNKVMCLHGGLSPKLTDWNDIKDIKRPVMNLAPGTLACDLTWSDPDKKSDDYLVNYKRDKKNGIGYMFGVRQVATVCKALDIDMIFRGHQAPMNGYELFGKHFITIFSAPGYRGVNEEGNYGSVAHVDEKGNIDIVRIGVSTEVRKTRNRQKLDKGEGYLDWAEIKDRPLEDDDERSC